MFKNLCAFIGTRETTLHLFSDEMVEMAQALRLQHPVATSWRSFGFVQPEEFGNSLVCDNWVGYQRAFAIGIAERALPGKCIRDELDKRRIEMEKRENRRLGRKEIAQMKDLVISELLPNAPIKTTVTRVIVSDSHWIMVDTGSPNRAEEIIAFLRSTVPIGDAGRPAATFSCVPLSGGNSTKWLRHIALDDPLYGTWHFSRLDSVVMKGSGGTVRLKDVDLSSDEAQHNLLSGRDVIELRMAYRRDDNQENEDMHCSVTDSLVIKRIKFSDILVKDIDDDAGEGYDKVQYFDASLMICANLFVSLLNKIAAETATPVVDDDEL